MTMKSIRSTGRRRALMLALLLGSASPALAFQPVAHNYNFPAQALGNALATLAQQSRIEIIAPAELVEGLRAPAVRGSYSLPDAIQLFLSGTGLVAERFGDALIIKRADGRRSKAAPQKEDGEITVTGTRIRGSSPVGAPVITIDREAIERSGYATTQQILQALPQNFGGGQNEATLGSGTRNNAGTNLGYGSSINLRGLGASSTLILFNGNRPALGGLGGVFADLSLVPSTAIERIEVLTDGASAIYGADAVAGVVNLRFRNRFEGAESRLRVGTADGDFGEVQLSQIVGKKWRNAHLVIAYEYYGRDRLAASKRAFATEDLRPFSGPDYRSTFAVPGTIIAADGQVFGVPAGQDGTALTPDQLIAGQTNRRDVRATTDILPRQRTHTLYAAGDVALSDTLTFRTSLLGARRDYSKIALPETSNAVTVSPTNPFYVDPIGTGQPIRVQYSFARDLGPEIDKGQVTGISGAAGLEKRLGRWQIQLLGTYGLQRDIGRDLNVPNRVRLAAALADPDPATAYNVFGDGGANNPSIIARVRGGRVSRNVYELWAAAGRATGPLLSVPAGDIHLAVGAEYRAEHYTARSLTDISTAAPIENLNPLLPGPRHVTSGYAELLLPLVGGDFTLPGIHRLDLSLAGRIEDYSDVGSTSNPRFGLRWDPVPGLALRGSYGTSFRAPSFEELIGPSVSFYLATPVADPQSPTGQSSVLALFGYAPGIKPEKATTWSLGFDLKPLSMPAFTLSLSYYDIDYRDRIGTASEDFLNFLARRDVFRGVVNDNPTPQEIAAYYAAPTFSNPFGIPASQITAILDGQIRNLSAVHQTGLDFDVGYAPDVLGGRLDLGIAGSYIFKIKRQLTEDSPAIDVVSTFANPVDLRLRGRAGWSNDTLIASAFLNFVNGYDNNIPATPERVSSWTTVDLQFAYTLGDKDSGKPLRFALSLSNLFDRRPPYVNNRTNTSALAYDPDNASAVGRMIAFQVSKAW